MFRLGVRAGLDLVLVELELAQPLYALIEANRNHLDPWLPWVDTTRSAEDVAAWIRSSLDQFARHEGWQAAIQTQDGLAGCIGFKPIDWANRRVEIGYWLARPFEGRGLMTDAVRFATNHAFGHWNLHRVEIHCAVENHRSAAVPRRLGFAQEGLLRGAFHGGGTYQDQLIFGMLRNDWKASDAPPEILDPRLGSK